MPTRLIGTHDRRRSPIAGSVALVLAVTLGATSASAVSPTACRVRNTDTGKSYTALQVAADAAKPGDRLTVRGTCVGKAIIDTKLLIEGVRTATSGKPTLSGAGKSRVVTITKGVRVRMRSIEIVRGSFPQGSGRGAGVLNRGTLTLVDVVVREDDAVALPCVGHSAVTPTLGT